MLPPTEEFLLSQIRTGRKLRAQNIAISPALRFHEVDESSSNPVAPVATSANPTKRVSVANAARIAAAIRMGYLYVSRYQLRLYSARSMSSINKPSDITEEWMTTWYRVTMTSDAPISDGQGEDVLR